MKVKIKDQIIDMEYSTFIKMLKKGKIPPQSLIRSEIITDGNWRRLEDLEMFRTIMADLPDEGRTENIDEIISLLEAQKSDLSTELQFLSYQRKLPVLTLFIIAVNVGIFLIQTLAGGSKNEELLIKLGAYAYPLIVYKNEYWRLISHTFLHIGIWHLLINMGVLYLLGSTLEGLYGKSRLLILYFISGLAGGIASLALVKVPIGAGASGAIFGLVGMMVASGIRYRERIPKRQKRGFGLRLMPFIAADLLLGFIIPGINNAAHIGGLIGGFAFAWLFPPLFFSEKSGKEKKPVKDLAILVAGIIFLCEVFVGINFPSSQADVNLVVKRQLRIRDKRYEQALDKYESALDKPYDINSYRTLEGIYMAMRQRSPKHGNKWNKKLENLYSKAISKDPTNPDWYNNFAWLYVQMNVKHSKAISLALKSLELSSDRPLYILDTLGWAYLRANQYKKALNTFEEVFDRNALNEKNSYESSWNGVLEIARSNVKREVFMDFYNRMANKLERRPELQTKLESALNEFRKHHGMSITPPHVKD